MYALRRVLYLEAALLFLFGVALAVAPASLLSHVFGTPAALVRERAWARVAGIEAFGLAMVMTMVGHRVEQLWWWSWAFAFTTFAMTAVVVLNAAFGLSSGESRVAWWIVSGVLIALTCGLLYGIYASSREQPLPG